MGFEFTYLQHLKTSTLSPLSPDEQICEMVKALSGKIKENWQVLAPSPMTRVLYFEPDEGYKKLDKVKGSGAVTRAMALGKDGLKKEKKKGKKNG